MVLLDTCTLLWLTGDQAKLSDVAREAILANAGGVCVSAISAWEITLKVSAGKLLIPLPPQEWYPAVLQHHGLLEIPVSGAIAIASALLPRIHTDPADRLLIATAIQEQIPLLTPDGHISAYGQVRVVW